MGAKTNPGVRQNGEKQRGCTFKQFNKQHPLSLRDCRMQWLQKIGSLQMVSEPPSNARSCGTGALDDMALTKTSGV
jgi:hypothetical protein